jgi:hypothetical protein
MISPLITKSCADCYTDYRVPSNCAAQSSRCPDCQREYKRQRSSRRYRQSTQYADHRPEAYTVILCPDDDWPRGATFSQIEVTETCRFGHFAPGTILKHRLARGVEIVEVVGGSFHRQSLNCLKKEE